MCVQMQTVPYLIDNPEVGYVQTRWIFANPDESYLTKAQEISLNFHCKCEQFVHFASGSFFNFNGTAGECASLLLEFSVSSCFTQWHSRALDVKQPQIHRLSSSIEGAASWSCISPVPSFAGHARFRVSCSPHPSSPHPSRMCSTMTLKAEHKITLCRSLEAQDHHDCGRLAESHHSGGHGPVSAHLRQRLEGRLSR